jgi:hypothetical protein
MEIELLMVELRAHLMQREIDLDRTHDAERIRQHEVLDAAFADLLHQAEHVVLVVAITVGPVFEVHVHAQALALRVSHRLAHVGGMLRERFAELVVAVLFTPLRQQVQHLAAGGNDPVDAVRAIDEAQHLDALEVAVVFRPARDRADRVLFTGRHARRCNLDTIDVQRLEQRLRDVQFFAGREGHALRLLAVAQGGVHQGDVGWKLRCVDAGIDC